MKSYDFSVFLKRNAQALSLCSPGVAHLLPYSFPAMIPEILFNKENKNEKTEYTAKEK